MVETAHGGPIEYASGALLLFQAWHVLTSWKRWSRTWIAIYTCMTMVSLVGLRWAWLGTLYNERDLPVGPAVAIICIAYFWIAFSSFAFLLIQAGRRVETANVAPRRQFLRAAGGALFAAPLATAAYGILRERLAVRVNELDFPVPNLHPDLQGLRIVQVSDLHVSPFLSVSDAARVIDMANELRPEIAFFTGDIVSELGDPLDEAIAELKRLRAYSGVYGCMGNHEGYVGCRDYLAQRTAEVGQKFLRGTSIQFTRGGGLLNIAGIDYQRSGSRSSYLPGAEKLVVPGATNLLLSHNPDVFPVAAARGFQAVLSGHTHGGQVNIEILHRNVNPARFKTPYTSGLYRLDAASCYVTTGVGTIGVPVRVGAPPEIALLRLVRA